MTAQNMIALGTTWAIVGKNQDIDHTTILWVWVKEIVG